MTFNIEDVRHAQAKEPGNQRLERLAEVIQRVRPNLLLLNEIELFQGTGLHLSTAQHFIKNYLMTSQNQGLEPINFTSLPLGSSTGTDTSSFRLRVDYALPSSDLTVLDSGIWRHGASEGFASDHFPVWVDLIAPSP